MYEEDKGKSSLDHPEIRFRRGGRGEVTKLYISQERIFTQWGKSLPQLSCSIHTNAHTLTPISPQLLVLSESPSALQSALSCGDNQLSSLP